MPHPSPRCPTSCCRNCYRASCVYQSIMLAMKLPEEILKKTLARCERLVSDGSNILESAENVPATTRLNSFTGRTYQATNGYKRLDAEKFIEWRTKAATLLSRVVPKGHVHRATVEGMSSLVNSYERLQEAVRLLRG